MPKKNLTDMERLMAFVTITRDGHWIWNGSRCGLNREYGQCKYLGKTTIAHRAMWSLIRGAIPKGMDVLHQCGKTLCVNPSHVRLGTQKENQEEAVAARGGKNWATGVKGERHGKSVLSDAQATSIINRHSNGERQAALALEFGVTQACISLIVNKKRRFLF